jgi:HEAT repeat protein
MMQMTVRPVRFVATLLVVLAVSPLATTTVRAQPTAGEGGPAVRAQFDALRDRAIEQVLLAARGEDGFLRANAIEAMQPIPTRALPLAQLGLNDEHPAVRFAALVTIGKLRLEGMGPSAVRMVDDRSPSVRAAAMFAAHQTGQDVDISPLAGMLRSPEPGVRANAAMLLGLIGDRSALPMLQEMSRLPLHRASAEEREIVRVQVAEAMVALGNDRALDVMRAGAYSNLDEVRVLSVQTMGRLRDRAMMASLPPMLRDGPIELRLAAAEALARLGSPQGLPTLLEAATHELETARAQAAFGLGLIADTRSAEALGRLLNDPSPLVRLSAAAAVLRAASAGGSRYRS